MRCLVNSLLAQSDSHLGPSLRPEPRFASVLQLFGLECFSRLASSLEVPHSQFRNPIVLPPSINKLAGGTDILIVGSDAKMSDLGETIGSCGI